MPTIQCQEPMKIYNGIILYRYVRYSYGNNFIEFKGYARMDWDTGYMEDMLVAEYIDFPEIIP